MSKEKGIKVSDIEVNNYINTIKKTITENEKSKEDFNVYLTSLGVSEDEFWNSKKTIKAYRNALMIGKYKGLYRVTIKEKYPNKSHSQIEKLVKKKINEQIAIKRKKIKIKKYQ
ncbi:MAG: hypothetical protein FH753_12380 [Firmicutes bacterium]|nr:hypothetical protein [Bacillota bacterium]